MVGTFLCVVDCEYFLQLSFHLLVRDGLFARSKLNSCQQIHQASLASIEGVRGVYSLAHDLAVVFEKTAPILLRFFPNSTCWHVKAMRLVISFVALKSTAQSNTRQNVVSHSERC